MSRAKAIRLIKNRKLMAIIAVLALTLLVGAQFQTATTYGPTASTITWEVDGKKVFKTYSYFELNSDEYLTGWKSNSGELISETIAVEKPWVEGDNSIHEVGPLWTLFGFDPIYWYEYYVNGKLYTTSEKFRGQINLETDINTLKGSAILAKPDSLNLVGTLEGNLNVKLKSDVTVYYDTVFGSKKSQTYYGATLGEYTAKLINGNAFVFFPEDIAEVGQTLKIPVRTHVSSGQGFDLRIIPPTHIGGSPIDLGKVEDNFNGDIEFDVPVDWFKEGADNEATVEIINGKFKGYQDVVWINDKIKLAPAGGGIQNTPSGGDDNDTSDNTFIPGDPTGTIQEINSDWLTGSSVGLKLKGTPNPETNEPIKYFRIYAWYGENWMMPGTDQISEYIVWKKDVPANSMNEASFYFRIPANKPGDITITARAVDTAGRGAESEAYTFVAKNPENPDGAGDSKDTMPPIEWVWTLEVYLLLVIGIAATAIIIFYAKTMGWKMKIQILAWGWFILSVVIALYGYGVV